MKKYCYLSLLFLFATFASILADTHSIAVITGTNKGVNLRLPAPFNEDVFAGTMNGKVGTKSAQFYCIDINHRLAYNENYTDVKSTSSKVTYVLNNFYPYKPLPYTGALAETKEAAAVQLAIWHFTDTLNVNAITVADVKARALDIIKEANEKAGTIQPFKTLLINMPQQSFKTGTQVEFYVEAYNEVGAPIKNASITLSVDEGTLSATSVVTNAAGVAGPVYLTAGPNNSTVISATASVTIPHGTEYHNVANPDSKQKLVIATPVVAVKNISESVTWHSYVNLSVQKTSSSQLVNDGDQVEYQITVKNNGTTDATNVQVSEVLPKILEYVGQEAGYDPEEGIWYAGSLKAGESKTLIVKTKAKYSASGAATFDLGMAKDFNVFVLNDLKQPSSDTEGRLAVGRNAELASYSVGDKLPANSGDVLVVGRKLTYTSGRVYNGNVVFGSFIDTTHWNLADGTIRQDSVIDFAKAELYLNNLSNQIAALTVTGSDTLEYGHLLLTGTNPVLNKFYITAEQVKNCNDFLIDVPANSVALVNVSGDSVIWQGGFTVKGATNENILLNFFEAEYLKISGIDLRASILAPRADLDFPTGLISGQVVARNITGSGQFNNAKFLGHITLDTTVTNFAEILFCDQPMEPAAAKPMSFITLSRTMQTSAVENKAGVLPEKFELKNNYPNPFNPSTRIAFNIAEAGEYSLKVYNSLGELIATLASGHMNAGTYEVNFNAAGLSSGVYFCELSGMNKRIVGKMTLSK